MTENEIEDLCRNWQSILARLRTQDLHLLAEYKSAWSQLILLVEESIAAPGIGRPDSGLTPLQQLERLYQEDLALLSVPVEKLFALRPMLRIRLAIADYRASLAGLVEAFPRSMSMTGSEFVSAFMPSEAGIAAQWRGLVWRDRRDVAIRDLVSDHLTERDGIRSHLDARLRVLATAAMLRLAQPWQTHRAEVLSALLDESQGARHPEESGIESFKKSAESVFRHIEVWADSGPAWLSGEMIQNPYPRKGRDGLPGVAGGSLVSEPWTRTERVVHATLELELQLGALGSGLIRETALLLGGLRLEQAAILGEISDSLDAFSSSKCQVDGSLSEAQLLGIQDRKEQWFKAASNRARVGLPDAIELVEPDTFAMRERSFRGIRPQRMFEAQLESTRDAVKSVGLIRVESARRTALREIERAKEVVGYGQTLAAQGESGGEALFAESRENARVLLEYQRSSLPDFASLAAEDPVRWQAHLLLGLHNAVESGRLGLLAHISKQRGIAKWRTLSRSGQKFLRDMAAGLVEQTAIVAQWLLTSLGIIQPVPKTVLAVDRRAALSDALQISLGVNSLPALYRRLFHLAPVTDARFLIGRDAELAALSDALNRWRGGLSSATLLVGGRGTGKTSLLNCALSDVRAEEQLCRGELPGRVTSADELHASLKTLLGLPADAALLEELRSRRRIIVLEELERGFIRALGGFDAMTALLDMIYRAGPSTCWIVCTNDMAYRYLNAAVGLGRHFAFYLNAAALEKEQFTAAIMQRHNLSGLRLEFAAPLRTSRGRIAEWFLLEKVSPQAAFFDSCYEQSEGTFRAAFELWQASIERVEDGTVFMRQPIVADYTAILGQLDLEDLFALQAIQQHGSLTSLDLARVLAISEDRGARLLERLCCLEIVEPEPGRTGARVKPEAQRVVRQALYRANLTMETPQ